MDALRVQYEGIDYWGRAVFVNTETKARYGCLEKLFNAMTPETEVLETVTSNDLVFFGNSFGCEPFGSKPLRKIEILKADNKSMKIGKKDLVLIMRIEKRAENIYPNTEVLSLSTAIAKCHCSGNRLRLGALLEAKESEFIYDTLGILWNINMETGKLENGFSPRYTDYSTPDTGECSTAEER